VSLHYTNDDKQDLIYRIKSLGAGLSILHIGAHPDDEDIGMIAYFARKYGIRVYYWSATRGEGGQNVVGQYQNEALGIVRTWETLAARAEDLGHALFGPFYDFGFAKDPEEAFFRWGGRDTVVAEITRVIRMTRPGIVISRWRGDPGDFHGHHQAVGLATIEAFDAAGDPDRYPHHLQNGLPSWRPVKLYLSTDNSGGDQSRGGALNLFGKVNPQFECEGYTRIDTGEFDPVTGLTYQQHAWKAYNRHQTQGMGFTPKPGSFYYYFKLYKSHADSDATSDFFSGMDYRLPGICNIAPAHTQELHERLTLLHEMLAIALEAYRVENSAKTAHILAGAVTEIRSICDFVERSGIPETTRAALITLLQQKSSEIESGYLECLGLEFECVASQNKVTPAERFTLEMRIWNPVGVKISQVDLAPVIPSGWQIQAHPVSADSSTTSNLLAERTFDVLVPDDAALSTPYWLVTPRDSFIYHWPDNDYCGQPFGPPEVQGQYKLKIDALEFSTRRAAVFRKSFPGGSAEMPVSVIPPVSLSPRAKESYVRCSEYRQTVDLDILVHNNSDRTAAFELLLNVPAGWTAEPSSLNVTLDRAGETRHITHTVHVPANTPSGDYKLNYLCKFADRVYQDVLEPVRIGPDSDADSVTEANCMRENFVVRPACVRSHVLRAEFIDGLRWGFIKGADEELTSTLRQLGVNLETIESIDIGYFDFEHYDAILIGPNAYIVNSDLRAHANRLVDYVRDGGTLLVQYQGYGYQQERFVPYPFQFSRPHDRVTQSDAPVKILEPEHSVFHIPNEITEADFSGWSQERGRYFFGTWDQRYIPLLASHDRNETYKEGGLVECQYGRGTYLYSGYSFFRQLPDGVQGAFRIFANLLAIPVARRLERAKFLRNNALFASLDEERLHALADVMFERWYEDGQTICEAGAREDELYVVYRGEVEVLDQTTGQATVQAVATEGDCIGEFAVLGDIPRSASMRARGNTQLLAIKGDEFREVLRKNPELSIDLIRVLVRKLIAPAPDPTK